VLGPRGAAVTVVVFSDFQCPYCNRGRAVLHDLRAAFPDDVRVVWKNLPLPRHADAPAAAEAALEVFAQGGDAAFWRYHDLLFGHQEHLSRADLERYAERLDLDLPRFRRALDEGVHTATVEADAALGHRLGVDGTPAFFVNGTPVVGARPLAVFEEIATAILARARTSGMGPRFYADMVRDPIPPPERGDGRSGWAEVHDLAIPAEAPSLGAATAPVVLQVFSDFQCPYCARVEPTLAALRAHYGERLRVVWRDFPLPGHAHAMPAAEAAREVRAQRGDAAFWRFHDALFEHRGELTPAVFEALADDHRHVAAIRADMAAIQATGVRFGTPAFFINGHFLAGARPVAEFRARIDGLLREPAPAR
jgi:protein-disulfide isomerase